MPVSIGGITVRVGLDSSALNQGMKNANTILKSFNRDLGKISVEGIIKGDPFSTVNKQLSKSRGMLSNVFNEWSSSIKSVNTPLDNLVKRSKASTDKIVKDWIKLKDKLRLSNIMNLDFLKGNLQSFDAAKAIYGKSKQGGFVPIQTLFGEGPYGKSQIYLDFKKQFDKIKKVYPEAEASINSLFDKIRRNVKVNRATLDKELEKIVSDVRFASKDLNKEFNKLGRDLQKGYLLQGGLKTASDIRTAKSEEVALKKRKKLITENIIANKRLNAEIRAGVDVKRNQVALMKNLERREELGIKLTRQQTVALRQYRKEQEKSRLAGGFLSKEWLTYRLKWFVQLRLAWAVWRGFGDALRDLVEYQNQLARAMRTARSETKSTEEITKDYSSAMKEMVRIHGVGWEQVGEALYQLGSAGLYAEESLAALNSTLSLIRGTEGDVREVTKGVAGIYNNFADQMKDFTTLEEKFVHINTVIAELWTRHQIEISELIQGFNRAAAMSKIAGVSFEELASILGVLNDHMIKSGIAGRSLQNVLMRISRQPVKFARAFGVTFDPTKPLEFNKIMETLNARMSEGATTAYGLAAAFEYLGIRGAPAFSTMVRYWQDIREEMNKVGKDEKALADLEGVLLDTLSGRWSQLLGNLRGFVAEANPIMNAVKGGIKYTNELMQHYRAMGVLSEVRKIKGQDEYVKYIRSLSVGQIDALKLYKESLEVTAKNAPRGSQDISIMESIIKTYPTLMKKVSEDRRKALQQEEKIRGSILREARETGRIDIKAFQNLTPMSKENLYLEATSLKERIALKKAELNLAERDVQLQRDLIEGRKDFPDIETALGQEKEYNNFLKERERIHSELVGLQVEREQEAIKQLNLEKEILETDRNRMLKGKDIVEDYDKITEKSEKIRQIDRDIAKHNRNIAIYQRDDAESRYKSFKLSLDLASSDKGYRDQSDEDALIAEKRRIIALKYERQLNDLQEQRFNIERQGGDNARELLYIDLQIQDIERKRAEEYAELFKKNTEEQARWREKERDALIGILRLSEKRRREENAIYDIYKRVEESTSSIRQASRDWGMTGISLWKTGFGKVLTDTTGGFQEQKQEVINLKAELKDLEEQYDEAISEDDVKKANDLREEMRGLRNEISNLEDPIYNLGEAFRSMLKDIVDGVRSVINEWIAMQIVMGIIKPIAGGTISSGSLGTTSSAPFGMTFGANRKHGGILPPITSFQAFSSGGITSSPTMALLGDNRSGKELVIPEENISKDSVSGYTRDSGGVYIANFITKEDIAGAMLSSPGKNVVVNHVMEDLGSHGVIWRKIGG